MKHWFGAITGIVALPIPFFLYFHNTSLAYIFAALAAICIIVLTTIKLKDQKYRAAPNTSNGFIIKALATDDNTRLVIKAISEEGDRFVNLNDIARDTNLSLRAINKSLDWLFIHNLATEIKGRTGKVYELTPSGRDTFSSIINPKKST